MLAQMRSPAAPAYFEVVGWRLKPGAKAVRIESYPRPTWLWTSTCPSGMRPGNCLRYVFWSVIAISKAIETG